MNRLIVLTPDADEFLNLLRDRSLANVEIVECPSEENARGSIQGCNIVLGKPALIAGALDNAIRLEWIQSTFAGVDALCKEGLRRDYVLTGVKGIFGPLMSEYVFAYILALERHLFETRENQLGRAWLDIPYRSLQGLTIGLCGFGSIGEHIALTATHFGMRVIAFKRTPAKHRNVERVYTEADFGEFLSLVDYLVLALPRTPATNHLIDYDALQKMRPSSVLINVGRGNVIVEDDLVRGLRERVIRAAVLDVFEQEPLPDNNTLWELPNVYLTPHNSAFSFPQQVVEIFCDNYQCFCEGKPLKYVIDFERGY